MKKGMTVRFPVHDGQRVTGQIRGPNMDPHNLNTAYAVEWRRKENPNYEPKKATDAKYFASVVPTVLIRKAKKQLKMFRPER